MARDRPLLILILVWALGMIVAGAMLARLGNRAASCYVQLENEDLRRRIAAPEQRPTAQIRRPEHG